MPESVPTASGGGGLRSPQFVCKNAVMPTMTDPSAVLPSFQQAVSRGSIKLERGTEHPELYIHADLPDGRNPRVTFARIEDGTVTVMVQFVEADPYEGLPCYAIGYAVPEAYRNQGRATDTVTKAISELWHGLRYRRTPTFYVEAVIDIENTASQRVAEQAISRTSKDAIDKISGRPALQYFCLCDESVFYPSTLPVEI